MQKVRGYTNQPTQHPDLSGEKVGCHFRQRLLAQLLAYPRPGNSALAIAQAYATVDLVAKDAIFGHEVLITQQELLIDGSSVTRQQVFPVHCLPASACAVPIDAEYG